MNPNMLTRKQMWRRCNSNKYKTNSYDDYDNTIFGVGFGDVRKSRIRFSIIVNVVLIPSVDDDIMKDTVSDIWYTADEIQQFKTEYIAELLNQKISNDLCDVDRTECVS